MSRLDKLLLLMETGEHHLMSVGVGVGWRGERTLKGALSGGSKQGRFAECGCSSPVLLAFGSG
jgi:hypothetical protein